MRVDLSTSFNKSRLTANCSIVSPVKAQAVAKCAIWLWPGPVARYLRNIGASVFGLDLSPRMLEQARQLNPDIRFLEGDMMAVVFPEEHSRVSWLSMQS